MFKIMLAAVDMYTNTDIECSVRYVTPVLSALVLHLHIPTTNFCKIIIKHDNAAVQSRDF